MYHGRRQGACAAREHGIKLIIGSEFMLDEELLLVLLAPNRVGYGQIAISSPLPDAADKVNTGCLCVISSLRPTSAWLSGYLETRCPAARCRLKSNMAAS